MRSRPALVALLAASTLVRASAAGDAREIAVAETLFVEGRRLMAEGKLVEACAKLEESQRLDPALGTKMNLAECYERTARTASAWALFASVAAEARKEGDADRASVAKERADLLFPCLARLTLSVADEVAGLVITLDSAPMGKAQWGTSLPVDLVPHRITARAPGRSPFELELPPPAERADLHVIVPPLRVAEAAPAALATVVPPPVAAYRMPLGIALTAGGVISMGAATYFALHARSTFGDSSPHCDGTGCDGTGVELRARAVRSGNAATLTSIAGVGLAGAGITLLLTTPRGATIAPAVGPSVASVLVGHVFLANTASLAMMSTICPSRTTGHEADDEPAGRASPRESHHEQSGRCFRLRTPERADVRSSERARRLVRLRRS